MKYIDAIKSWLEGKDVQVYVRMRWIDVNREKPIFHPSLEYRLKSQEKSPGQILFETMHPSDNWFDQSSETQNAYINYSKAVIEAYKQGEEL